MADSDRTLEIELPEAVSTGYAGEWLPLALSLRCPADRMSSVTLKHIHCRDKEVQIDSDLFQKDLELRPGESCQLTLPVRIPYPKVVNLDQITIQVGRDEIVQHDEAVRLPARIIAIRPALDREIDLTVKAVCAYEQGTKVELTIAHRGQTSFQDLVVTVDPPSAIRAGKRIVRLPTFAPGETEKFELIAASDALEVTMSAVAGGEPTQSRRTVAVAQPSSRARRAFRFLEPHRLSTDDVAVFRETDSEEEPVLPVAGSYRLQAGGQYTIRIRPRDPHVTRVHLGGIPGLLHVRKHEEDKGDWKFLVNITYSERFTKAERLFYDVEGKDGTLQGEIPIELRPTRGKHLQLACALGIAITLQGIGALSRMLFRPNVSLLDAFDHFDMGHDYQLLFPLAIPVAWAGLHVYDWIQFRLSE